LLLFILTESHHILAHSERSSKVTKLLVLLLVFRILLLAYFLFLLLKHLELSLQFIDKLLVLFRIVEV
jgi:hypothetical protein